MPALSEITVSKTGFLSLSFYGKDNMLRHLSIKENPNQTKKKTNRLHGRPVGPTLSEPVVG